jgi:hypothetical protein
MQTEQTDSEVIFRWPGQIGMSTSVRRDPGGGRQMGRVASHHAWPAQRVHRCCNATEPSEETGWWQHRNRAPGRLNGCIRGIRMPATSASCWSSPINFLLLLGSILLGLTAIPNSGAQSSDRRGCGYYRSTDGDC